MAELYIRTPRYVSPAEHSTVIAPSILHVGTAAALSGLVFVSPLAARLEISPIDVVYLFYGAVLGIICGLVGLIGFVLMAISPGWEMPFADKSID